MLIIKVDKTINAIIGRTKASLYLGLILTKWLEMQIAKKQIIVKGSAKVNNGNVAYGSFDTSVVKNATTAYGAFGIMQANLRNGIIKTKALIANKEV